MGEGSYGKEPFDLRWTVLFLMSRWKYIVVWTLAGTLLFGGLYFVRKVVLRGGDWYQARSLYRVEYAVSDEKLDQAYINDYTWNVYVHTDEFLESVKHRLQGSGLEQLDRDRLGGCITGNLESDWRLPSTVVLAQDPGQCQAIAQAVEAVMTEEFPAGIRELESIRLIDGGEAQKVIPDVRVGRAFVLAAVLSLFFTVVIFLLKEIGSDSIRIPAVIRQRYGLRTLGTIESRELTENVRYLFRGIERAAVCAVCEDVDPAEVTAALKRACGGTESPQFYPVPSPLLCPECAGALREARGILLAASAGAHGGKQLEYALEYLTQQDCKITAVLLWGADEKLLKYYYGLERKKGCRQGGKDWL